MDFRHLGAFSFSVVLVIAYIPIACSGGSDDGGSGGSGAAGSGGAGGDSGSKTCPVDKDPCYQQLLAEYDTAKGCFYHPNTCTTSNGKDASGCGQLSGGTCSYPDGSKWVQTLGTPDVTIVFGASGQECFRYNGFTEVVFPGGKTFTEASANGVWSLTCPDGTSVDFPSPVSDYSCGVLEPWGNCCVSASGKCNS